MNFLKYSVDYFIPIIMIILGGLFIINPPDKINEHCGYRTKRSMRSAKAWIFANTNLGKLWVAFGIISVITIFILKTTLILSPQIISIVGILLPIILIFLSLEIVEEELKFNLDKKN